MEWFEEEKKKKEYPVSSTDNPTETERREFNYIKSSRGLQKAKNTEIRRPFLVIQVRFREGVEPNVNLAADSRCPTAQMLASPRELPRQRPGWAGCVNSLGADCGGL